MRVKMASTILLTSIIVLILTCSVYGQVPGDLNCDISVDAGDCSPFILAMTDPTGYAAAYPACNIMHADMNANTIIDCNDWTLFQQALGQPLPPCADIPCPLNVSSVPTITEWGMIIFTVLAGLVAACFIKRKRGLES